MSSSPADEPSTFPKTTDTESNLKKIWILLFKEPMLPPLPTHIQSIKSTLPTLFFHWALRVGDDIFELKTTKVLGEIRYQRRSWKELKGRFEKKEYKGTTSDSTDTLSKEAERVILKFQMETIGYHYVVANCQEFVRQLEGRIVKTSDLRPTAARPPRPDVKEDVLSYLNEALCRTTSGTITSKEALDDLLRKVKYLGCVAMGYGLSCLGSILTGISDLLAGVGTISGEALAWLLEGLQELVNFLRPLSGRFLKAAVDGFTELVRLAAPLLNQLSQAPTCAWNALAAVSWTQVLAGVLVVVAAAGGIWLAWKGFTRFRAWWKKNGQMVIQFEQHELEILPEIPAIEVVVRRAVRSPPVAVD